LIFGKEDVRSVRVALRVARINLGEPATDSTTRSGRLEKVLTVSFRPTVVRDGRFGENAKGLLIVGARITIPQRRTPATSPGGTTETSQRYLERYRVDLLPGDKSRRDD
jgi:hypothetical protein